MSDSSTGRAPRTDAEWARDISARLRSLENARTLRVGDWVIAPHNGHLVASSSSTGATFNLSLPQQVVSETEGPDRGFILTDAAVQEIANTASQQTLAELLEQLTGSAMGGVDALGDLLRQLLYGQIAPNRLPLVPLSSLVGLTTVNLLDAPGFDAAISVVGGGVWDWDSTIGRTTLGSVHTEVDGTERILWSNEILVAPGDVLDLSIYIRRDGLVGNAAAAGFDVVTFKGSTPLSEHVITTTAGTADALNPRWRKSSGSFTVSEADCDRIRMQLRVLSSATAGQVWFDDGVVSKRRSLIPQAWVDHLPDDLLNLGDRISGLIGELTSLGQQVVDFLSRFDLVDRVIAAINDRLGVLDKGLLDFLERLNNFDGTLSGLLDRVLHLDKTVLDFLKQFDVIDSIITTVEARLTALDNLTGGMLTRLNGYGDELAEFLSRLNIFDGRLTGLDGGLAALGDKVTGIVNYIAKGASNLVDAVFDPPDLFGLINSLLTGVQSANASIAEWLNREKPPNGVDVAVKFDTFAENSGVPAAFAAISTAGSGTVTIKNGCLDWIDSGNQKASRLYLYRTTALATDIFEVSAIVPRPAENLLMSGPSYNFLIGAANTAGTEFCVVRFGHEGIQFGYASGTANVDNIAWKGAFQSEKPPAGAAVRFRGEQVGNAVVLTVYVNNKPVASYTDSTGLMKLDATHRACGLGFMANTRNLGQATPGSVSMFLMSDGLPPTRELTI